MVSVVFALSVAFAAFPRSGASETPDKSGGFRVLNHAERAPLGLETSEWQNIRAAHEAWRHKFRDTGGVWQARNPAQQWTARFDGRGFLAAPAAASWSWGLQLMSYGYRSSQVLVEGTAEPVADGSRLIYNWTDGLREWYINDGRGLEHGYTVPDRPAGAKDGEPLVFTLSTCGDLWPTLSENKRTVTFRDEAGAATVNYAGLKVWDADGQILPSRFELVSENDFQIVVEETKARYPLTIDPIAQQAFLKADNSEAGDLFGGSVAISGDTVVVGAFSEDSSTTGINSVPDNTASKSGAVYVFVRSGDTWSQQAYLKPDNTGASDEFGRSVAISGDMIVVGAPQEDSNTSGANSSPVDNLGQFFNAGAAYIFVRDGATWSQQAYLKASNPGNNHNFGWSVAASGETAIIGAPGEWSSTTGVNSIPDSEAGNSGAAYIFVRDGAAWSQQAYLKASNTEVNDNFGRSVGVDSNTVVVGADEQDDGRSNSGAAYVFVRSEGLWSQDAYLKADLPQFSARFGQAVAVSGDTVAVGAPREDNIVAEGGFSAVGTDTLTVPGVNFDERLEAGETYSLEITGQSSLTPSVGLIELTNWSGNSLITGPVDLFADGVFVDSVDLLEGGIEVGMGYILRKGFPNSRATDSGAVYVFERDGGAWSQRSYLKASTTGGFREREGDLFGWSVGIAGNTLVVGAVEEDSSTTGVDTTPNDNAFDSGAAYVFVRSGVTWDQEAYLKADNAGASDKFGQSVAVSGDTVVVGAWFEDSSATGINGSPDDDAANSGAVYIFSGFENEVDPEDLYQDLAAIAGLTGSDALPEATPFNDGIPNLLKFAFNMNLAGPDNSTLEAGGNSGLPSAILIKETGADFWRFEYVRRRNSGLIYTPQRSNTLNNADFAPMPGASTITEIDAEWERVMIDQPLDLASEPRGFGRLRVEFP